MAIICPTVTAYDPHQFREQVERVTPFARRIHIDLTDGRFAEKQTIAIEQAWWPDYVQADLHLMYKQPETIMPTILRLAPHLVIIHAEADGNFLKMAQELHLHGIKVGVAILPGTKADDIRPALGEIDHVLIFSGHLGHFGGHANMALVGRASELKALKPQLEIGWDGGINAENAKTLAHNGVNVLNVGGFIQNAHNPREAYAKLRAVLTGA
jgi:ribulose-phosphate 3-epimerase